MRPSFARATPAFVWGVVMVAALGAAGVVVGVSPTSGPDATTELVAAVDPQAVDRLGRDVRRLAAEREQLAQRLGQLERGVGELKLAARASLDPETTGSITKPAQTAGPDAKRLAEEREDLARRLGQLERGVGELKLAARATDAEPTSGAAPAARPTAAVRTQVFAVALGAEPSVDAARRRWATLSGRYPRVLARLAPRTARGGAGLVDLVAGPFATAADAVRACQDLRADGASCDAAPYAGDPLGRP